MVLTCVAGASLFSCTQEQVTPEVMHPVREISFRMEVAPWEQAFPTKGIPYNEEDKPEDLSFGVAAYTVTASGTDAKRYFGPTKVFFDTDAGRWTMDAPAAWPNRGASIRFFAYGPYDADVMETPESALPQLHYSASKMDMEAQRGLLVYASDPLPDYPATSSGAEIQFRFRHVLSAVSFIMGEGIEIESISVNGVYDEGTYDYASDEWEELKTAEASYRIAQPEVEEYEGFAFVDAKHTLLFPPQMCPEGASIHLEAGGKSMDIPLSGHQWKQGHIVLYILGRNDYHYEFEVPEVDDLLSEGGELDVEVESWRERDDGGKEWVPWIVEGYYPSAEDAEAKENKLADSFVSVSPSESPDVDGKGFLQISYAPASYRTESAISFDGTLYWMNFHIGASAMGQGLVHLAVLDDRGLVMWSYLLWVSPGPEDEAGVLSSQNLGWIEKGVARETIYDEATVYVRLEQQKIGGKHCIFRVHRPEHVVRETESDGYSPYYQFGRKDPLIPSVWNNDVAMYGLHTALEQTTAKSTVGKSIREPWSHLSYGIKSPFDWCQDTGKDNWWSGKTVYDPCPPGYRMPLEAEIDGFVGILPRLGYRNSAKGQPVNVGKEGYYWSASARDEDNAAILHVSVDGSVEPDVARRSRGLSVRPIHL